MRRSGLPPAIVAAVLIPLAPPPLAAQLPSPGDSPLEFGAALGVAVGQPAEAFGSCDPSGTRVTGSLSAGYSPLAWLAVELVGTGHGDMSETLCPVDESRAPRGPGVYSFRQYPRRIRGEPFFTTSVRVVLSALPAHRPVRPYLLAGAGRIWSKELGYPELGAGVSVTMGHFTLRAEAAGRRLSLPYDSVTIRVDENFEPSEVFRVGREEVFYPLHLRVGVGWRP